MRRSKRALLPSVAAVLAFASACTHDWDFYDPSKASLSAGADSGQDATTAEDAAGQADGTTTTPPVKSSVSCATNTKGAKLVGVGSSGGGYCIDATETTRAQYKAFLSAVGPGGTTGQPAECAGNTSYVPTGGWPGTAAEQAMPVVYVNWCDAHAYCSWAGKRLCGLIGGGEYDVEFATNSAKSEWLNACSLGDTRLYAYGPTYNPNACNGRDRYPDAASASPVAVGTLATCVGAVDGIFDLSGNVFEWDGACLLDQATPSSSQCLYRGGGYANREETLQCKPSEKLGILQVLPTIGFRCCADAADGGAPIPDAGKGGDAQAVTDGGIGN